MYIETSSPRQPGDNAKLSSPKLIFRGNMCLQFYYHMYGSDVRTLNVTINGKTVFNASGNKGDVWLKANVDFYLWGVYVVRTQFMAKRADMCSISYFIVLTSWSCMSLFTSKRYGIKRILWGMNLKSLCSVTNGRKGSFQEFRNSSINTIKRKGFF